MIKITAECVVKAGKIEEFKRTAEKLVDATRAHDTGCISYELFQDMENENVFFFLETWESMDVLKQHGEKPHFKEAMELAGKITEKEMVVHKMNLVK